ncbi:MAG: AMP-dependent synthetase [Planctomycetota bacterium]|nr:MAG: AMP-dependent synthetase [Planctomycetota bacterium]
MMNLEYKINQINKILSPSFQIDKNLDVSCCEELWSLISKKYLSKDIPFDVHEKIFHAVYDLDNYKDMQEMSVWEPSKEVIDQSNIANIQTENGFNNYNQLFQWSVDKYPQFWEQTVGNLDIRFKKKYQEVVDISQGVENPEWLKNASMNIVDSCFLGRDGVAVVYQDSDNVIHKKSYAELQSLTSRVSNSLKASGINKGDKVAIYMPMTYESVAIYLGIIQCGAVAVTIADSFSPAEIKVRLALTSPKILFCYESFTRMSKEMHFYAKVKGANIAKVVVLTPSNEEASVEEKDISWQSFLLDADNYESCECRPSDHTTILFSSGTTGEPKGIPWNHVSPIKGASDGFYHQNIKKGDVVCWPTNLGWMMGPWLVFATLINKGTIALFYDAPTLENFGEFVQKSEVTMLGVIPSIVRAWKNKKNMEKWDWSSIKCYSSTGECSNPDEMFYLSYLANYKPIIEYCGGTEISGGYVASTCVQANKLSAFSTPTLGLNFFLYDEDGCPSNKGEVFIMPPSIGLSQELLNRDHHKIYFVDTPVLQDGTQLRKHGDLLEKINGYYKAHGRSDDSMNLGGIKVSSIQIEEVVNTLPEIEESAAIAVSPKNGGPSLLILYVVTVSKNINLEIYKKLIQNVIKEKLNPLFRVGQVIEINLLPRTASNKIMRKELRKKHEE